MNKMDEKLFEFADEDKKTSLNQFMKINDRKSFSEGIHQITYYDAGESDTLIMLLCRSRGFNSGRNSEKRVSCPLRYLDTNNYIQTTDLHIGYLHLHY